MRLEQGLAQTISSALGSPRAPASPQDFIKQSITSCPPQMNSLSGVALVSHLQHSLSTSLQDQPQLINLVHKKMENYS